MPQTYDFRRKPEHVGVLLIVGHQSLRCIKQQQALRHIICSDIQATMLLSFRYLTIDANIPTIAASSAARISVSPASSQLTQPTSF